MGLFRKDPTPAFTAPVVEAVLAKADAWDGADDVSTVAAEVVNVRKVDLDDEDVVRIDRRSIFGNPFTHLKLAHTAAKWKVGSPEEAIEAYRTYFNNRTKQDAKFRRKALNLQGKRLACWCKPADCHGDVIVEWLAEQTRAQRVEEAS